MAEEPGEVAQLLEFARELRWSDVPEPVRERTVQGVVDTVGVMLGGVDSDPSVRAQAVVSRTEGVGSVRPVGIDRPVSWASAAWLSGISGHALDYDDTHWPTILHGSNPALAAALAAAGGEGGVTGEDLLTAYLAGFEVAARVSNSMPTGHYDRGWHITGSTGGIGVAVAVSRLLGADLDVLRIAVAHAANTGSGHRQHFGSNAKPANSGNAARNGLTAALLARQGFDADPAGIEGRVGFWRVMCDAPKPEALVDGLGSTWEMMVNGIKPYPCGVVSHPVLAGAERVLANGAVAVADIEKIDLLVHPLVVELTGKTTLHSDHDVKFSIRTLVALTCLGHARDVTAYSAAFVNSRPDVLALFERISVAASDQLGHDQAVVTVTRKDGSQATEKVDAAPGSPGDPIGWDVLRDKITRLIAARVGGARVRPAPRDVRRQVMAEPFEDLLPNLAPQVLGALRAPARPVRRLRGRRPGSPARRRPAMAPRRHPGAPPDLADPVATRALIDHWRTDSARRRREATAALGPTNQPSPGDDDTLVLLFLCCHPALSPPSGLALTFRTVSGLSTAQIAAAFLVPQATMERRIGRAKQRIRGAGARFELPEPADRAGRLAVVLHVLYLIFNEGYTATSGPELTRVDPEREAIRLARLLHRLQPGHAEVAGLLALMLLTDARRAARTDPDGSLVPLAEQRRDRWDSAAIAEGQGPLTRTLGAGPVGPYQIQAAIAALHDEAPTAADTDGPQILALYDVLTQVDPGPVVTLSRAVALAMVHGPAAGLIALGTLDADDRLTHHHRLEAVRAHLLEQAGDHGAARDSHLHAARMTASLPEQRYLAQHAAELPPPGSTC